MGILPGADQREVGDGGMVGWSRAKESGFVTPFSVACKIWN